METISPTPEQLSRGNWQRPARDQKTSRTAYRRYSQAEDAHRRGDLDHDQLRAAEKLLRHILGAAGVNVSQDEGGGYSDDAEYPVIYHGAKIAQARRAIGNDRTWRAVHDFVVEARTLKEIGTRTGITSHVTSRALGLGIVISGLDTLAVQWGIAQRQPPD